MWINIDVIPQHQEIIYLPKSIVGKLSGNVYVEFGCRRVLSKIAAANELSADDGNSYNSAINIKISDKLGSKLLIPDSMTYQMKIYRDHVVIGPVIGLLLGNHNHLYSPKHMEKYSDRCRILDRVGGLIYAFSPGSIDWENNIIYGLYYSKKDDKWSYGRFPFPSVIYRRDFHTNPEVITKLMKITDGRLFNSWRFSKYFLYQYISKDGELSDYLPPTELSESYKQLKGMLDEYGRIILKPINLSRGRGICIIKKAGSSYIVNDYRKKEEENITLNGEGELEEFFNKNKLLFDSYIVQRHLSLARVEGSPFDIRVVMQKDYSLKWKCSGIECRVAGKSILLTNISRGGYALTIDEALNKTFPGDSDINALKEKLYRLCYKICYQLDQMGPHFAEFGMDIAIDNDKHFWIIEVNVFPSFKGFKKMDHDTYLAIRYAPIYYATRLAGF